MHQAAENVIRQRMERTAQALRKNNMEAICVDSAAEVLPLLEPSVAPGGVVICESERDARLPETVGGLTRVKQYNYGKILVTRYQKEVQA